MSILYSRSDEIGRGKLELGNASGGWRRSGFSFSGFRYVRPKTPAPMIRIESRGADSWVVEGGGMAMLSISGDSGWRVMKRKGMGVVLGLLV